MLEIIKNDKIPGKNFFYYVLIIISLISAFDVTSEILEESIDFFSENIVKKISLWVIIYLKTESIYYSCVFSIIIFLLFPKIFFGKKSSPTLNKKSKC